MRIELFPLYVSLFEFVCMHADTGHLFSALAFAEALTCSILITMWVHAWLQPRAPTYPTCAFWFCLFVILVTVVSLVMFCIVAKWYKKR